MAPDVTIIIGELRAKGGITLRDLSLVDRRDALPEFTPALRARGSLVLERVWVYGDGESSVLTTGFSGGYTPLVRVVDSKFESPGGIGLTVDVPMSESSKIKRNLFTGQRLGVDLSVDVLFAEIPFQQRMAEFEKAVEDLQKSNTFIGVGTPVSGGRG